MNKLILNLESCSMYQILPQRNGSRHKLYIGLENELTSIFLYTDLIT